MEHTNDGTVCASCGGRLLSAGDELVCNMCGATNSIHPDTTYKASGGRVSETPYELGSYLGPYEGIRAKDYPGFNFSGSTASYIKVISDHGVVDPGTKKYEYVSNIIERCAEALHLSSHIILDAKRISKKILKSPDLKRGMLPSVAATAVILACRFDGKRPVSWRRLKAIMSNLGYSVRFRYVIDVETRSEERPRVDMKAYVRYFVKKTLADPNLLRRLAISHVPPIVYESKLESTAIEVLHRIGKVRFYGYSPFAISATSIYIAESLLSEREGRKRFFNLAEITRDLGVSRSTLREQITKFRKLVFAHQSVTETDDELSDDR